MKKLLLPLFAALALAACGNNADGEDGIDANDSTENAIQNAGNETADGLNNANDSIDLHNDKNDVDGKDTMRDPD